MPTKAQLVATAVSLGVLTKSDAKKMNKADIEEALRLWTPSEHDKTSSGGMDRGEPVRHGEASQSENGGYMQPAPAMGHIVLLLDETGRPVDIAIITSMSEDGTLDIESVTGDHYQLNASDQGTGFDNTGVREGDFIQFGYDTNGPKSVRKSAKGIVSGIRMGEGTPFFAVTMYETKTDTILVTTNDAGHAVNQMSGAKVQNNTVVETNDIERVWSFDDDGVTTVEFSQEGWHYYNKLDAVTGTGITAHPATPDEQFVVHTRPREERVKRARQGIVSHVSIVSPGVAEGSNGTPSLMQHRLWHGCSGIVRFLASNETITDLGKKVLPFSSTGLHPTVYEVVTLDAIEPPQQDQVDTSEAKQQQASESSSENQEGMMKESRRTLADLKGTPDEPKKKSVSKDRIKELVNETVAESESLEQAVEQVIGRKRNELRELLGVNDDLKELGDTVLDEIEDTFKKFSLGLDEWKRATEEKITSKVEFSVPDMPTVTLEDVHMAFDDLLFNCVMRLPTLLVGPSGSFKTSAAKRISHVLNQPFGYVALGPTQTEAKFAGYPDAQGHFVPTEFYLRYKYGGVMLLDELDAGNPSVLVWINGAIQNREAAFPRGFMTKLEQDGFHDEAEELIEAGGMVDMHPDCIIIATANTFGRGADLVYQGRNALDGATLKRFKVLIWDYDEALERKIAGDDVWVSFVQTVRQAVSELDLHHIVSPVDSIDGAKMLAAGQDWNKVAAQTVFAGLSNDDVEKVLHEKSTKTTLKILQTTLDKRAENQAGA